MSIFLTLCISSLTVWCGSCVRHLPRQRVLLSSFNGWWQRGWSYIVHCSCVVADVTSCQHRQCTNLIPRRYASHPSVCLHDLLLVHFFFFFVLLVPVILFYMFKMVSTEVALKKHCQRCPFLWVSDISKDVGVNQRQSFHILSEGQCQGWHWDHRVGPSSACQTLRDCGVATDTAWRLSCTALFAAHLVSMLCLVMSCILLVWWCFVYDWAAAWVTFSSLSHPKVWRGGSLLFHRQPQLPPSCQDHVVSGDQTLLPTYTRHPCRVPARSTLCRPGGCQSGKTSISKVLTYLLMSLECCMLFGWLGLIDIIADCILNSLLEIKLWIHQSY